MKVIHVSHTAIVSGAEHSLLTLISAMAPENEAGLAAPSGELANRARRAGLTVHPMPAFNVSLHLSARSLTSGIVDLVRAALAVRSAAARTGATVVHANSIRAAVIAILARAAGGPPIVMHVRDVLPQGRLPALLRVITGACVAAVVAPSRYTAERFCAGRAPRAAVHIVENAIDLRRFDPDPAASAAVRAEFRVDADRPLLGIIGQISSWKGHDTVVRALAELRDEGIAATLLVVGTIKFAERSTRLDNPSFLASLQAEIERLALHADVIFTGERDDIPAVIGALDLLLAPSVEEPFGRTVIEAMAAGTPVVATAVGGPAETIEPGTTGRLAPPGDKSAWADAVRDALTDRKQTDAMARRASAVARTRFDADDHAARMIKIFAAVSRR